MPPVLIPASSDDAEFMFQLYASSRAEEISILGWDERQQAAFTRMQFVVRERSYASMYPMAERFVIVSDRERVGAMIVDRSERALTLIDIVLLPEARGRGLGTTLIRDLIRESSTANKPLRLHVAKGNRAASLYYRLGFEKITENGMEDGMYDYLELAPNPASTKVSEEMQVQRAAHD